MPAPPEEMFAAVSRLGRALLARYLAARPPGTLGRFGADEGEVAALLRGERPAVTPPAALEQEVHEACDRLRAGSAEQPLVRLVDVCGLDELDLLIVGALLAPEIDPALERAYTYAWNDFTCKRPRVGFLVDLVAGADGARRHAALARLDEAAPLRRRGVVEVGATSDEIPPGARAVRLADRVVAFLHGQDGFDDDVSTLCRIAARPPQLADLVLDPACVDQVRRALDLDGGGAHARLLLAGRSGCGRATLVEALMAEHGRPAVRVDLAAILEDPRWTAARLGEAVREAALRRGACVLEGGDRSGAEPRRSQIDAVGAALAGAPVPVVFVLRERVAWLIDAVPDLVEIDVAPPDARQRLELWRRSLPAAAAPTDGGDLELVAGRYAFTGGAIALAARRAVNAARLRDPDAPRVTLADLGEAARLMFSHRLGSVAQRIPAGFAWDDLVLPADILEQIREVVHFARERPFLLEEWGFAHKLPYGRGVSAILAGPPGTGKTMVAQILAGELGYDLFRVDLAQVVNKYVGETEKNLARIFEEAEDSHAVLFFDEADALFAKRTDVRTATDRYANLEVNYLLQRMETYDGVTLLATNLEQGIDEAFKRRVRFAIQFELPDADERERLWRSMLPASTPLADGIDWRALAERFEMAGGYIKKAVIRAALTAARERPRRPVTGDDLVAAAVREYREMGRLTAG